MVKRYGDKMEIRSTDIKFNCADRSGNKAKRIKVKEDGVSKVTMGQVKKREREREIEEVKRKAVVRSKRNNLMDTLSEIMSMPTVEKGEAIKYLESNGFEKGTVSEATIACYNMVQRAKYDTQSFVALRDSIGQKPVDRAVVAELQADCGEILSKHFGAKK